MRLLLVAGGLAAAAGALAQPTPLPEPRLAWRATVTPPSAPASAADWRQSNELMRRLGGHAGHLRGQTPDTLPGRAVGQEHGPAHGQLPASSREGAPAARPSSGAGR